MKWFWKKEKASYTDNRNYEDYRITTVYVKDKTYKVEVVDPKYYYDPFWYSIALTSIINVYKLDPDGWQHKYKESIVWDRDKDSAESLKQEICKSIENHENEIKRNREIKMLDGQSIDCKCKVVK